MDWGTFKGKLADGAKIGFQESLKGGPTKTKKGMGKVFKDATNAQKKYDPKPKPRFPFFK